MPTPANDAPSLEDDNDELHSVAADLMNHDGFLAWDEDSPDVEMMMEDDEEMDGGGGGGSDDNDDDDDGDDGSDDVGVGGSGTDGVTTLMGELSIDSLLDNVESSIEWGGYDYDPDHEDVDDDEEDDA